MKDIKKPTLFQSVLPLIALIIFITTNITISPDDTLSGGNQLALMGASAIAIAICYLNNIRWAPIMQGVTHTLVTAIPAILILFVIGMLAGTWMLSGVVPSMIYYGLKIISPEFFLPAAVIISLLVSLSVGSSWSTIATVGVALLGIGEALGFDSSITAGAIISGAYFGDKVSPMSDTTNLSSAVGDVPLFVHIKYMMTTTIPSLIITLLIFIGMTFFGANSIDSLPHTTIASSLESYYNISPVLFAVPVLTIFLIYKKVPAIAVLFIGSLIGAVFALIFQWDIIMQMSGGDSSVAAVYGVITKTMYGATQAISGDAALDRLLSTGGMIGMLNTVWLIIMAMVFGGIMEAGGFLNTIMEKILSRVHSTGGVVSATVGTSIMFNLTAGDQYMSIVVPGKMFKGAFKKANLKNEVLSRTIEDSATVTSVLVPWNTCGATQASILGVATTAYAPYAFFCYISPLMSMLFAWLNIKIRREDEKVDR